jgi:hypothetical protein
MSWVSCQPEDTNSLIVEALVVAAEVWITVEGTSLDSRTLCRPQLILTTKLKRVRGNRILDQVFPFGVFQLPPHVLYGTSWLTIPLCESQSMYLPTTCRRERA